MNLYDCFMKPLEAWLLRDIRSELMPLARGDVLEAGIGTGANAAYYTYSAIRSITGLDTMREPGLEAKYPQGAFSFAKGSLEALPFENEGFDCVVTSLVLCSVDADKSLHEIKRVLRPGGLYIFLEHIRPAGPVAGPLFDSINAVWPRMANGCNLNRRTDMTLERSAFSDLRIKKAGGVFIYGTARAAGEAKSPDA